MQYSNIYISGSAMNKDQELKQSPTKNKLVESGKTLFYKYGYRKVTVEEICRQAGLSKMTFYRFFENKSDLVRYILLELAGDGMKAYREIMDSGLSFEEKMRESIRLKRESAKQYSDEFLTDVYRDRDGDIMPMLMKIYGDSMVMMMEDYRKAQEQGQIRKDLNLTFIPYFLNKMNDMLQDPALLTLYGNNIHEIMSELTNLFFYGILEPGSCLKDEI